MKLHGEFSLDRGGHGRDLPARIFFCLLLFAAASSIAMPDAMLPDAMAQNRRRGAQKPKMPALPQTTNRRQMKIAEVDPHTADRVALGARRIDQLVDANYGKYDVEPNPLTTDEQFVRRVYLDITGCIPTYHQAKLFLDSSDPDKRAKLIDRLLNSPGYASHFYNYWADILRLTERPNPNLTGAPYNEWVKQALRENMPYDEMVRSMLTASGKMWEDPAVGYLLRDSGMPLESMDNTIRTFLGTRIGCAQCHNHPFDHWTQRQFYQMAAFTYGTKTRVDGRDPAYSNGNPIERVRDELKAKDPEDKGNGPYVRLMRANTFVVQDDEKRELRLPHDYAYSNGKPKEVIKPAVIFDPPIQWQPGQNRREVFAQWLTSKQNPRFASVIANRLWKRAMGIGLIEPVDDLRDETMAENEELLDYLTRIVVHLDFDLKEYQRILYNTRTYQRQSSARDDSVDEQYHFSGPLLRRMTAEQVWDSLLALAIQRPDANLRPTTSFIAKLADVDLATVAAHQVVPQAEEYEERYGRKAQQELNREFGYKGQLLMRASELPSPVPPDHFLRQFGQGDRELISGASTVGTVPQLLTMFNGPVTHMMLEEGSVIYDNVIRADSVNERINVIFLSVLGRNPAAGDRQLALREIETFGAAGYGNVIWALINTREFLFIQ